MSLPTINQKEYLKKYLSLGSDDKKKKKRKKVTRAERFQVVDDDIDLKNMQPVEGSDYNLYELAEDAPLVVGFVDERPEELKALELFRNSKWKIIQDEHGIEDIKVREENVTTNKKSTANTTDNEVVPSVSNRHDAKHPKYKADKRTSPGVDSGNYSKTYDDSDVSPPRKSHGAADSDESPPRVARDHRKSPKRSHRELPKDSMRKKESSPPRKSKHDLMGRSRPNYYDSDESPPRKSRAKGDSDDPVPRRSRFNESSDESPPRKSRFKEDSDDSRGRSRKKYKHSSGRSHKHEKMHIKSMPTSRRDQIDSDESPPRRAEISQRVKPSRWSNRESGDEEKSAILPTKSKNNKGSNTKRMEKQETTLEGKKAGLQDSNELRIENMQHHLREKEMFSKMGDELSGRNATTIVRDRATGKKRDLTREAEEKEAEREKENEKKEKYSKWGRGLKQVEEHQSRLVEDLYEMSKPLARYADDEDLEKHLKEQEREGDPMQEYIRSNKIKKDKENKGKGGEAKEKYPVYQGPQPPPNRFGIRPGYRWDGVDRSTGYEQKWFQEQNSRKALQEEAYKWSTEDM